MFLLENGIVRSLFTHQLFSDSKTINSYPILGEYLMLELETRRKFSAANRNVAIIQCGENNILRNIQSEENKAVFRFDENTALNKRFTDFLNNTDIILNPLHSPMGNQDKMRKRRVLFSNHNRAYSEHTFPLPTLMLKNPYITSLFSTHVSMAKNKSL